MLGMVWLLLNPPPSAVSERVKSAKSPWMPRFSSISRHLVSSFRFRAFLSFASGLYLKKVLQSLQRWDSSPGFRLAPIFEFSLPQWRQTCSDDFCGDRPLDCLFDAGCATIVAGIFWIMERWIIGLSGVPLLFYPPLYSLSRNCYSGSR